MIFNMHLSNINQKSKKEEKSIYKYFVRYCIILIIGIFLVLPLNG